MRNEEKIIGMIQDLGTTLGGKIENGLTDLETRLTSKIEALDAKMTGMNADIGSIKVDVNSLKTDVAVLKTDVGGLKSSFAEMKDSQDAMAETLIRLDDRMDAMETYVHEKVATKEDLVPLVARVTRLEQIQGIA